MRAKLSLQTIMEHFRKRWSRLPDTRKPNNNTKYSIADGALSALAVFFMQFGSFLAHQRLLEKKKGRSNARSLFQVDEIPSDPQQVNWLELTIAHEKTVQVLYQNRFVTNHNVTNTKVVQIAEVGRTRWKIESENNNMLKTKGCHLEHNFGHGQQDLANVLAALNILAFLIHTIQEITEPACQRLRHALGTRKTFFNDLRALTRYMVFETWDDLFSFMEEGLEIIPETP